MNYIIKSNNLSVAISDTGAEPQSIIYNNEEYLWQANPDIWGKHAPLLFPIIGRLRDSSYQLNDQTITAPRHGFCRSRVFNASQPNETTVIFSTQEDKNTLDCFPFNFFLEVEFHVEENTLTKTHRITNTGSALLPFELGGHEAYKIDTFQNGWNLQFENIKQIEAFDMDEEGILTLPKWKVDLPQSKLTKTPEELDIDTIILEKVPNSHVILSENSSLSKTQTKETTKSITIDFKDFDYLGIWTMAKVGKPQYLCVEPWTTLPDGHFMEKDIFSKPGIQIVKPGETKELSYQMTFN